MPNITCLKAFPYNLRADEEYIIKESLNHDLKVTVNTYSIRINSISWSINQRQRRRLGNLIIHEFYYRVRAQVSQMNPLIRRLKLVPDKLIWGPERDLYTVPVFYDVTHSQILNPFECLKQLVTLI